MGDGPDIDRFEKRLRFLCGFLFGGIIAFAQIGMTVTASGGWSGAAIGLAAVVSGWLAIRFGDDFWRSVVDGWFRRD